MADNAMVRPQEKSRVKTSFLCLTTLLLAPLAVLDAGQAI